MIMLMVVKNDFKKISTTYPKGNQKFNLTETSSNMNRRKETVSPLSAYCFTNIGCGRFSISIFYRDLSSKKKAKSLPLSSCVVHVSST